MKAVTGAAAGRLLLAGGLFPPPGEGERKRPDPPGSRELVAARKRMVETLIARPRDDRAPVRSQAVLEAMRTAPRHAVVPPERRRRSYDDTPLPIGHGQTISQPCIVAPMTELLELMPDSKVLEVGTGSGYQAAVPAQLTPRARSLEVIQPLHQGAKQALAEQGYRAAAVLAALLYLIAGWVSPRLPGSEGPVAAPGARLPTGTPRPASPSAPCSSPRVGSPGGPA